MVTFGSQKSSYCEAPGLCKYCPGITQRNFGIGNSDICASKVWWIWWVKNELVDKLDLWNWNIMNLILVGSRVNIASHQPKLTLQHFWNLPNSCGRMGVKSLRETEHFLTLLKISTSVGTAILNYRIEWLQDHSLHAALSLCFLLLLFYFRISHSFGEGGRGIFTWDSAIMKPRQCFNDMNWIKNQTQKSTSWQQLIEQFKIAVEGPSLENVCLATYHAKISYTTECTILIH